MTSFRLSRPASAHPRLFVSLPTAQLSPPSGCSAHLLVSLPPALFLDPHSLAPYAAQVLPLHVSSVQHYGSVELEAAVGWSTTQKKTRRPVSERDELDAEKTVVLLSLSAPGKVQLDTWGRDAATGIRYIDAASPWDYEYELESSTHTLLSLPLHARYLPPTTSPRPPHSPSLPPYVPSRAAELPIIGPLMDALARSDRYGRYFAPRMQRPELVWSCDSGWKAQAALEQARSHADADESWERIDASQLSVPSHLLPSLRASSVLSTQRTLLRPSYSDFSAGQAMALSVRLPQGEAQLYTLVAPLTAALMLLCAAWVLGATSRALRKVKEAEKIVRG